MRVTLTGVELDGIAKRLTERLESALRATVRRGASQGPVRVQGRAAGIDGNAVDEIWRGLARELAPLVCPEDAPLTAKQARNLMGIRRSKWHQLRKEGRVPDPVKTPCGDRWRRSAILRCMSEDTE